MICQKLCQISVRVGITRRKSICLGKGSSNEEDPPSITQLGDLCKYSLTRRLTSQSKKCWWHFNPWSPFTNVCTNKCRAFKAEPATQFHQIHASHGFQGWCLVLLEKDCTGLKGVKTIGSGTHGCLAAVSNPGVIDGYSHYIHGLLLTKQIALPQKIGNL